MKETIEALKKEYDIWSAKAKALEAQSKEASHNAEIIQQTIRLMKHREQMPSELELFLQPMKTDKYKGKSMAEAILIILANEANLNGKEIYQRLEQNGFESKSKTLQRDVYTRLYNLEKDGKLTSIINDDKGKCYSLPIKEVVK
jgi:FtsZ-interacting cell division protein ZipA